MIDELFKNLGFSRKEQTVYTALLGLGQATATEVSKRTELNRTTIYDIVDQLMHKGLISSIRKKKTTYYLALDPRQLLAHLEQEEREYVASVERKKKTVRELLPQLQSLQRPDSTKPRVSFFEGDKGVREAYEDTLTSDGMLYSYTNYETMKEVMPNLFPEYFKRRAKAKLPIKAVLINNKAGREIVEHNKEDLRQTRFAPAETEPWSPEVKIYNDKVMIASWKEKMAVIIESKEYADLQKTVHQLLWETLPRN